MKEKYNKPPIVVPAQIKLLEDRGLIIPDKELAEKVLSNINYYRLSAYFKSFQKEKDKFDGGAKFDDILELYEFDRKLRHFVLIAIEIIEILIKTKIAYLLAIKSGPYSYRDKNNFNPNKLVKFEEWFAQCERNIQRKTETFVGYHFEKYEGFLPVWKFVEVISFSMASKMFSNLKYETQCLISGDFKYSTSFLENSLYKLSNTRNLCAHHMRAWNREIRPKLSLKNAKFMGLNADKVGIVLCLLNDMLEKTYFDNNFKKKWRIEIENLIDGHPCVADFWEHIGLPENWKEHPLWKKP